MPLRCKNCGYLKDENDAHAGISHYPFSKAHPFQPYIVVKPMRPIHKPTPVASPKEIE